MQNNSFHKNRSPTRKTTYISLTQATRLLKHFIPLFCNVVNKGYKNKSKIHQNQP
uniref:Uncharacterized protein n=1 Tax=Rhizophora mucronata TaxID=61149 RepID=A0A2P2QF65_RHIMU